MFAKPSPSNGQISSATSSASSNWLIAKKGTLGQSNLSSSRDSNSGSGTGLLTQGVSGSQGQSANNIINAAINRLKENKSLKQQ